MTEPHPHSSEFSAHNLLTWGDYQFAIWYSLAGELQIGRVRRGVQRWGIDHDQYEFAGTPRTVLALPVGDDEHLYPTVALDSRGFLHVWANMHDSPMRYVKSTTAHTTDDWLTTAGWVTAVSDFPDNQAGNTYPVPVHFGDGGLLFFIRDVPAVGAGGSGRGDSVFYRRSADGTAWEGRTQYFQGLAVPDAGGVGIPGSGHGVDDITNWSGYPSVPVVESERCPHPGRLHMTWIWRVYSDNSGTGNIVPSYAYSDDRAATWYAIDGTALTLPFTVRNNHAARIPAGSAVVNSILRSFNIVVATLETTVAEAGISNGQTVTVDVQDTSYNGTFTIGAVGPGGPFALAANQIAWGQAAANDPSGGIGSVSTRIMANGASLTIDDDGMPHILADTGPTFYMHRDADNAAWEIDTLGNPLAGKQHQLYGQAAWLREHLWMLKMQGITSARRWYPNLWRLTSAAAADTTFRMGGYVDSFGEWEPAFDPEAYRRFGTIEVLTPDGNVPRVATFGRRTRVRPRAA